VQVTVFTSSRQDAGATIALAVTLYGSKGPPVTSTAASPGTQQQGSTPAAAPMTNSGRCELSAGGEKSRTVLEPGRSCSFVLPSMRGLGQLRQLLLEVDTSGMDVQVSSARPGRWRQATWHAAACKSARPCIVSLSVSLDALDVNKAVMRSH
jgi:hypothetical protein